VAVVAAVGAFGGRLLVLALVLLMALGWPSVLLAGPVDWRSVGTSEEGEQWWDTGSLRIDRDGRLSVLSRYRPAPPEGAAPSARLPAGTLYVMQLDCDQGLYRDTSIRGLPQFGTPWQPAGEDSLVDRVLRAACEAGAPLLASR
jgi:hypothetical protein